MGDVRLAVVGAGLIGHRHVAAVRACAGARLCAIVDPADAAAALAAQEGVAHFPGLEGLWEGAPPDGLIVATPNSGHAHAAAPAVAAGVPALVEKPFVDDLAAGVALVEAAEAAGVALLCGHHRRYTSLVEAAKAQIEDGALGRIVSVHANAWLMKPDDYFNVAWRRADGGGPILINLIHDIDMLRHLVGDVRAVAAFASDAVRGFQVEDAAVVALRFEGGAVGTLNVADAIPAPWSWELTAGENPAYPRTDAPCCMIGGTMGSLEIPSLAHWSQPAERSWWAPMTRTSHPRAPDADPLVAQIAHFAAVIRGEAVPRVSGRDGLKAVAVVEAIKASAATGKAVAPVV